MYRRILFLTTCALFCTSTFAQYANIDGYFRSEGTTLNLFPLDSEAGVIAANTTVAMGGCSGGVAGIGKMKGDELKFSPYVKVGKDEKWFDKSEQRDKWKLSLY